MADHDVVAAHAQHDDARYRHAGKRASLQRARDADGEAQHGDGHGEDRVTMQRLAQKEARQQCGDERRGAEHQQHVRDRGQAKGEDEAHETSGKQHGAGKQCPAGISNVDQCAAPLENKEWQHRGDEERRPPERHVPGR
jgi:hypothetical protein